MARSGSSADPLYAQSSQPVGQGQTLAYASVSAALAGANTLVAAAGAGARIYVVSYLLVAAGAVTVEFRSGVTPISGVMSLAANGQVRADGQPSSPLFRTAANEALGLQLGGAVQVSGHLTYFMAA